MAELSTYEPYPAKPSDWVLVYGSGLDMISEATWDGQTVEVTPVDAESIYVLAGTASGELKLVDSEGNPAALWIEIGDGEENQEKPPELTSLSAESVFAGEAIYVEGTALSAVESAGLNDALGMTTPAWAEAQADETVVVTIPDNLQPGQYQLFVESPAGRSNELTVEIWAQADGSPSEY